MIPEVQTFLENYGWYMVLVLVVYVWLVRPYVKKIWQNKALIQQKKYDEQIDATYQAKIEEARLRMQKEYEHERKKAKEIEAKLPNKSSDFDALSFVKNKIYRKPIVVFSKTTCPYCRASDYEIVELDQLIHCNQIQDVLQSMTGVRTVPRVFIKSECIGGCDDTVQAHRDGKIEKMLHLANVNFFV